jgi:hypothetical protein
VVFPQRVEPADAQIVFRMSNMERNINMERNMKSHLYGAIAALSLIATPVLAETTVPQSNTMSSPGSGTGVHGQPGGKNGPAMPHNGNLRPQQTNPTTAQQDTKGVQGKPGSKSGPAIMPPSRNQR